MIEDLKNVLSRDFKNLSFDLSFWNTVLSASSYASVYHQVSNVDYYSAYFQGENISFVLIEDHKPIAIFPIFAYQDNNEWKISSNSLGVISPLFIRDIPKKSRKRLEKQLIEIILLISKKLKLRKIALFEHSHFLSNWFLLWLERADKDFITYQLAIDLQQSVESIKLDFRKSYKPLVNKALKDWDVKVCEENVDEVFQEFKDLHFEAAGKQTRSKESWCIQRKQIENNEAFLVSVRDGSLLIGAGFFNFSRDMGTYSVGAYKRDLFDKPIGHAVQMIAINQLKDLGCKTYILGQKAVALSSSVSSKKEASISHFKEGFAGYVFAQPHLEISLNE
jgi:FemAB family protein